MNSIQAHVEMVKNFFEENFKLSLKSEFIQEVYEEVIPLDQRDELGETQFEMIVKLLVY